MDAEFAGLVASGRYDAALVWAATDNYRFAAEVGAVEELDGDEESIHVDVEDGGDRRRFIGAGRVVFGAESCQVRHGISVRLPSGGGNEGKWVGHFAWNTNLTRGIRRHKWPASEGGPYMR